MKASCVSGSRNRVKVDSVKCSRRKALSGPEGRGCFLRTSSSHYTLWGSYSVEQVYCSCPVCSVCRDSSGGKEIFRPFQFCCFSCSEVLPIRSDLARIIFSPYFWTGDRVSNLGSLKKYVRAPDEVRKKCVISPANNDSSLTPVQLVRDSSGKQHPELGSRTVFTLSSFVMKWQGHNDSRSAWWGEVNPSPVARFASKSSYSAQFIFFFVPTQFK